MPAHLLGYIEVLLSTMLKSRVISYLGGFCPIQRTDFDTSGVGCIGNVFNIRGHAQQMLRINIVQTRKGD